MHTYTAVCGVYLHVLTVTMLERLLFLGRNEKAALTFDPRIYHGENTVSQGLNYACHAWTAPAGHARSQTDRAQHGNKCLHHFSSEPDERRSWTPRTPEGIHASGQRLAIHILIL